MLLYTYLIHTFVVGARLGLFLPVLFVRIHLENSFDVRNSSNGVINMFIGFFEMELDFEVFSFFLILFGKDFD